MENHLESIKSFYKFLVSKAWSTDIFVELYDSSSDQRISMVAFDINDHFYRNYKTQGSQFKAMLATNSKMEAIRYLEAFEELGN